MSFRRPTLATAIIALIALAIMLGLGFWQLERREWKRDLLATIDERLQTLAEPMPANPGPEWEFRRVTVQGEVVRGRWFRLPGHSRDGKPGEALMLLIRRDDGTIVAVEHAWVPFGADPPGVPFAIAAEGILRRPTEPGWFTPNNDPASNAWYQINPPDMAAAAGLPGQVTETMYLKPADWRPILPNDHLQYAATWFSLAGVFVIIFIVFHRQKPEPAAS